MAGRTPQIGLIVNPDARQVRREALVDQRPWEGIVPAELTCVTRNTAEVTRAVQSLLGRNLDALAILGGDGTIQWTLSAALATDPARSLPPLIILSGGTSNVLSAELGLRGVSIRRLLLAARAALATGTPLLAPLHTLRVEEVDPATGTLRRPPLYGFIFGCGYTYRGIEVYQRAAEPGFKDAVRAALHPIAAALHPAERRRFYAPLNMRVRDLAGTTPANRNGNPAGDAPLWLPGTANVAIASMLDHPILWFRPFTGELSGRPAFHFAANGMSAGALVRNVWPLVRGRHQDPRHRVAIATAIGIEIDGEEGFFVDGELFPFAAPASPPAASSTPSAPAPPSAPRRTLLRLGVGPRVQALIPAPIATRPAPHPFPAAPRLAGRALEPVLSAALDRGPDNLDTAPFIAWFRARYGDNLLGVLLFGSCLSETTRSTTSFPDFFAVVDDYARTPDPWWERRTHRFLPPSLYHGRVDLNGTPADFKYYVISTGDLLRETGAAARDLYIQGRLAKRQHLAWCASATAREPILRAHLQAVQGVVGLAATLAGPDPTTRDALIHSALGLSYRAEQRLEGSAKIDTLFASAPRHYRLAYGIVIDALCRQGRLRHDPANDTLRSTASAAERDAAGAFIARSRIRHRLRWPKMILTVDNWIDQLQAKLERTHGIVIEVPPWERRIILITGWRHFIRLRRQGKVS